MRVLFAFIVVIAATSIGSISKATPNVLGKITRHSPGYYSTTVGDIKLTLDARNLRTDVKIDLVVGFGGSEDNAGSTFGWNFQRRIPMHKLDSGYWVVEFEQTIHVRSQPTMLTSMQFYFEIRHPNGSVEKWNGSPNSSSYYQAEIPEAPELAPWNVEVIKPDCSEALEEEIH